MPPANGSRSEPATLVAATQRSVARAFLPVPARLYAVPIPDGICPTEGKNPLDVHLSIKQRFNLGADYATQVTRLPGI